MHYFLTIEGELGVARGKWIYFWNSDYIPLHLKVHPSAMLPSAPTVLNPRASVAPRIACVLCRSKSQGYSKALVSGRRIT